VAWFIKRGQIQRCQLRREKSPAVLYLSAVLMLGGEKDSRPWYPYAPAPTPTCFPHFYPASPSSASLFPHHLPHIFLCFLLSSPFCHSLQPFLFVLSLSSSPLNFLPFVLTLWFTKTLSLSPPLHSYLSSPRFSCSRPLWPLFFQSDLPEFQFIKHIVDSEC
jgi:hypothetical protein